MDECGRDQDAGAEVLAVEDYPALSFALRGQVAEEWEAACYKALVTADLPRHIAGQVIARWTR